MNLQSPNQLPATTPATTSTNTSPAAGQAVGVRPVAGASLGVDFAQIMARQFQRLPSLQKQQLADSSQLTQAAQGLNSVNDNAADRNLQDAQQARSTNAHPLEDSQTQVSLRDAAGASHSPVVEPSAANPLAHAPKTKAGVDPKDSKLSTPATPLTTLTPIGLALNLPPAAPVLNPTQAATATALTGVAAAQSAPSAGTDVTLVSSTSGQAPVMAHAMLSNPWLKNVALISSTSQSNDNSSELKTVTLSPKLSIVTPANNATSPESLTAFAQSMGLEDSAIAKLLNPSTSSSSVAAGVDASSAATLSQASATAQSALPSLATQQAATQSSAASQLAAMGVTSFEVTQSAAANPASSPASTQAQAVTSMQNSATVLANTIDNTSNLAFAPQVVSASAGIVGGTSATALKSSAAFTSDSALSTVDALHLIDTGVSANDVAALSSGMAAGDFSGNNTGQQGASNGGFGQGFATLTAAAASSNTNPPADPATQAAQAPSEAKMQEVYDQLSDNLATEMATRMHKQLNDGQWKMKFGLRPANLGGVEIQLEMKDGKLNASFNVDNPLTGHLLQNAAARLRETLGNFGIQAGQVQIGQNTSGQSQGGQQGNSQQSSSQPQVMENSSRLNSTANESQSDNPVKSPSESSSILDLFA
jgi:flagellar hook-length control protein FliK